MLPFSATCSSSAKRCWSMGSALRGSLLQSTTRPVHSTCFRTRDDEIEAEGCRSSEARLSVACAHGQPATTPYSNPSAGDFVGRERTCLRSVVATLGRLRGRFPTGVHSAVGDSLAYLATSAVGWLVDEMRARHLDERPRDVGRNAPLLPKRAYGLRGVLVERRPSLQQHLRRHVHERCWVTAV